MPQPEGLSDRTALVTGAGSGLGRSIALRLASEGARCLLVGRDVGKLRIVEGLITDAGGSSRSIPCDVSGPESVQALTDELVDDDVSILINNAGVAGPVADLVDVQPDEWDAVFAANVRGVYLMCRAVLPSMLAAGRGSIVNIASVTGKRPLAGRSPYAASKMAVLGLTTTLALEVAGRGVSVNSLSPGPVAGERMQTNFRREAARSGISVAEAERNFVGRAAQARMVTEDEVAAAVVAMLLLSGLCGADIDLSAGMFAR